MGVAGTSKVNKEYLMQYHSTLRVIWIKSEILSFKILSTYCDMKMALPFWWKFMKEKCLWAYLRILILGAIAINFLCMNAFLHSLSAF